MKRLAFVLIAALAISLAMGGIAYANFAIHGGYSTNTDACAGCHRAHTSFSTLKWRGLNDDPSLPAARSSLLISNAANMTTFCYVCHGEGAPGASTNVQYGVFDSGPAGAKGVAVGTSVGSGPTQATTLYLTNSTFGAPLNGGGFDRVAYTGMSGLARGGLYYELPASVTTATVTSSHNMGVSGTSWGWIDPNVASSSLGNPYEPNTLDPFQCTDCHDPHGSSNYRLLKDTVNGYTRGGYVSGLPDAYVLSVESGYPAGGWKKSSAGGADDMASYKPDYTTPLYAKNSGRAMSQWCAGCHTAYVIESDVSAGNWYDYNNQTLLGAGQTSGDTYTGLLSSENTFSGTGLVPGSSEAPFQFHRHPMDVPLTVGRGTDRALTVELLNSTQLPLEMDATLIADRDNPGDTPWTADFTSNISCLTCHVAHGTAAPMSGYARSVYSPDNYASGDASGTIGTDRTNNLVTSPPLGTGSVALVLPVKETWVAGVDPVFDSALLRWPNRGVCQRCHDK